MGSATWLNVTEPPDGLPIRSSDLLLAAGCKELSLELDGGSGDGPQPDVQSALETLHPLLVSGGCTSLQLSGLDLGAPDSLDCLTAKELPELYIAGIDSCTNVSAQHLRAIARLAAPRLGNIILSQNGYLEGSRPGRTQLFEGLVALCLARRHKPGQFGALQVACFQREGHSGGKEALVQLRAAGVVPCRVQLTVETGLPDPDPEPDA